jgi:hypothetical protein
MKINNVAVPGFEQRQKGQGCLLSQKAKFQTHSTLSIAKKEPTSPGFESPLIPSNFACLLTRMSFANGMSSISDSSHYFGTNQK